MLDGDATSNSSMFSSALTSEEETAKGVPPEGVIVQVHDKMSVPARLPITPSVETNARRP
jgi:hypothetical protein